MNIFSDITLQQPLWLWLFPFLFILYWLLNKHSKTIKFHRLEYFPDTRNQQVRHPLSSLLSRASESASVKNAIYSLLFWITIAAFCLALTGPQRLGKKLPDPPRQRDIIFIIDTSVSMTLRDYLLDGQRIDRMSIIRAMLNEFIQKLKGDKLSIIAFADTAHILSPLTNDTALLRNLLPKLRTGIAGRSNAIGDAISLAIKQTKKNTLRRQVLILVSDAALPTGTILAEQAARLAKKENLPLYTIAVGAGNYAAEEERITGLIYHPANLPLMQRLAEITHAKTYQAGDHASLQSAINDIEKLEKVSRQQSPRYVNEPLYHWPLFLAILLISLAQITNLVVNKSKKLDFWRSTS